MASKVIDLFYHLRVKLHILFLTGIYLYVSVTGRILAHRSVRGKRPVFGG